MDLPRPSDVVMLDTDYAEERRVEPLITQNDVLLSTVDGRHCSPPIPVRVGQPENMQTFYVHKDILTKAVWFRRALCGGFKEATEQAIDLPEEDPAIFHFLVAFLYNGSFTPIKSAAELESESEKGREEWKGKGKRKLVEEGPNAESPFTASSNAGPSSSQSASSLQSASSSQSRGGTRAKVNDPSVSALVTRLSTHRPSCECPRCNKQKTCSTCSFRRSSGGWGREGYHAVGYMAHGHGHGRRARSRLSQEPETPPPGFEGEDLRTWLAAYELTIDVYVLAERFMMDDFGAVVRSHCIDMLEAAGFDAAHPTVLNLCSKLFAGVPNTDPLLKMVLARMGFMQKVFYKRVPDETRQFLIANPEVVTLMLRETVLKHDELKMSNWKFELPPMDTDKLGVGPVVT
ncbi:hypothetical protein G7046_g4364 [Stylonectria norvegica]|nr:hypothetical protein G7046_g4364 [Stylonectria norvegica]